MPKRFTRPLTIAFGALATTMLSGCYDGGVYGAGYASRGDCAARYGDGWYNYDGYAYDDGYGYDCYDASDYGGGFVQIGFGGGWYDNYYYPGHGLWMFDSYRNRYPLNGQYLNYWGGRRAWWKHHGKRGDGKPGRPGWHRDRDDDRGRGNGRPGWNRGDRDDDRPRGTRPRRGAEGATGTTDAIRTPPATDPGENYSRSRGGAATRRDQGVIRRDRSPPVARPAAVRRTDPPPRAAPTAAPRPAAATPRPAPVARPAPPPRPNRADRLGKVREN